MSERILTEEELRGIVLYNDGSNYEATVIDKLVASHYALNARNAKLVHENDELMAEHVKLREIIDHQHILLEKYETMINGG